MRVIKMKMNKQWLLAIGIFAVIILLGVDIALRIRGDGQQETAAPAKTELSEQREVKSSSAEDRAAPGREAEETPTAPEADPFGKDGEESPAPTGTSSQAPAPTSTPSGGRNYPETGESPSPTPVSPKPDALVTPTAQPIDPAPEESGSYDDSSPEDELPRDV